MQSELEELLAWNMHCMGLPEAVQEYRFHPERKWRFDFAYPEQKIAIEVEGGTWAGGRHSRGAGFQGDCEKYNEAVLLGWKILRFTSGMINSTSAVDTIKRLLDKESE